MKRLIKQYLKYCLSFYLSKLLPYPSQTYVSPDKQLRLFFVLRMKYFLHDTSAFEDEKITELHIKFGYEGVGLFFTILEKLAFQEKPVKTIVLKKQLRVGKKLEKVWEFLEQINLISSNNGETFNKQLLNFSEKYQVKKEKNRKRISQWRENQSNTENVTHYESVRNTPKVNKSKVKEREAIEEENLPLDDFEILPEEKEKTLHEQLQENFNPTPYTRQPIIPSKNEVWEVFQRHGGTPYMAKTFYDKHESTGWYLNGSPIVGFHNLVGKYVGTWKENEEKKKAFLPKEPPPTKRITFEDIMAERERNEAIRQEKYRLKEIEDEKQAKLNPQPPPEEKKVFVPSEKPPPLKKSSHLSSLK